MRATIQEFLPTIVFLGKFLGIYLVANLLYGVYVTSFEPGPDPLTHAVGQQTCVALTTFGWASTPYKNDDSPTTKVVYHDKSILSIYEGCNGVNVMIIFVAFLFAFGPISHRLWWYVPLGLLVLHLSNLLRITVLFWVSLYEPDFMYFLHKYFFTAALYVVTFILWVIWVRMYVRPKTIKV